LIIDTLIIISIFYGFNPINFFTLSIYAYLAFFHLEYPRVLISKVFFLSSMVANFGKIIGYIFVLGN
jgi:hypothetical protein